MFCDIGAVRCAEYLETEDVFQAVDDFYVVPGCGNDHQFFSGEHVPEEPGQAVEPVKLLPVVSFDVTHLF